MLDQNNDMRSSGSFLLATQRQLLTPIAWRIMGLILVATFVGLGGRLGTRGPLPYAVELCIYALLAMDVWM